LYSIPRENLKRNISLQDSKAQSMDAKDMTGERRKRRMRAFPGAFGLKPVSCF